MCKLCNTDNKPYLFKDKAPYTRGLYIFEYIFPTIQKRTHINTGRVSYYVSSNRKNEAIHKTFCNEGDAILYAQSKGVKEEKSLARLFSDVSLDYTGERPCKKCLASLSMDTFKKHGVDFMVIRRLFNRATIGKKEETKTQSSLLSMKTNIRLSKNIDKNITLYIVNGKATYRVTFKLNKKYTSKSFSVLSDAIVYRNYMELQRVKRTKGKLVRKPEGANIHSMTNTKTKHKSFIVKVHIVDMGGLEKTFKSLDDAVKWRDKMLKEQAYKRKRKRYRVRHENTN
jgi:hypothetical protein